LGFKSTAFSAILLLLSSSVALGAVDTSYEKLVLDEIEQIRKERIEDRKIEVLARLQMLNAPQTNLSSVSNTSLHSSNKNISRVESTQKTKVE
jgi:archaellum component FlaF (FlaF/FlaG flagellin family)